MEKYYEVIERTLQLLETIEEGFDYIQNQVAELRYEEAFTILQDIMEGIDSIERAIYPMKDGLVENNIDILAVSVRESMNKTVSIYEQSKEVDLENQMAKEIFPAFRSWKEEIERVLMPYVVS